MPTSRRENNLFKNKVKMFISKAKSQYYENAFLSSASSMSATWKLIKSLISCSTSPKQIHRIIWNNIEYFDDLQIANIFNSYFL